MGHRGKRAVRWCAACVAVSAVFVSADNAEAAIAFVGSSSASTTATSTTLSIAKPTGVVSGDVEIATLSLTTPGTVTPPSGWTQIISTQASTNLQEASFWHVAGASEGATSWTFSASTAAAGGIAVYSGVDTTTIVDAAAGQTAASGKTATIPSVTAGYAGDFVLGAGAFDNLGTLSGSATKRYSVTGTGAQGPIMLEQDATQSSAGASTAQTVTDTSSATSSIGQTIALKAASATGILSVQATGSPSFSANLNAGDQTASYTVPLTTTASVSPAKGWNETITSTQFASAGKTLATGASTITSAPTSACLSAYANCTAPTNSVTYPLTVPAASTAPTAIKFFDAASGTGAGAFTVTPTIHVAVPQNSFAGSYTSTVTVAIVSGP